MSVIEFQPRSRVLSNTNYHPPYPFGMSTTTDQQSPSRDGKADTVSEGTTSTATTDVAPNDPMNSSPQDKQDTLKNKISIW